MSHFRKTSSNIKKYSYDRENNFLEVEFRNGKAGRYYDVPESLFQAMRRSKSKGKFLNERIKKAGYEYGETIF